MFLETLSHIMWGQDAEKAHRGVFEENGPRQNPTYG